MFFCIDTKSHFILRGKCQKTGLLVWHTGSLGTGELEKYRNVA